MNKYTANHFSNTVGTVTLIAVVLAAQVAPVGIEVEVKSKIQEQFVSSTFGQYSNPITGNFVNIQNPVDFNLAKAYENLLTKSIAPDSEIEAVISKNLWSLYEE